MNEAIHEPNHDPATTTFRITEYLDMRAFVDSTDDRAFDRLPDLYMQFLYTTLGHGNSASELVALADQLREDADPRSQAWSAAMLREVPEGDRDSRWHDLVRALGGDVSRELLNPSDIDRTELRDDGLQ